MTARLAWIAAVCLLAACAAMPTTPTPAPASPVAIPTATPAALQPAPATPAPATPAATQTSSTQPTPAAAATASAPTATRPVRATVPKASPAATAVPTATGAATPCPPAETGAPVSLRPDICVRKVLTLGNGFIRLRRDPTSGVLYALHSNAEIQRITLNSDGSATSRLAFGARDIGGGGYTLGMAFGPDGALYVVGNANRGGDGMCTVRKFANGAWSTLVALDWYPLGGTQYDHRCNGIVVSPDNRYVYFNNGSRTEHGEVADNKGAAPGLREIALTSAVFRVPVSAANLLLQNDEAALKSNGFLYADGLRNAFDLAFGTNGRLYGTENGPDADFPEELNELRAGAHYGFPWRFGAQDNPTRFAGYDPARDRRLNTDFVAVQRRTYQYDPDFPPPPAAFADPIVNTGPDANQFRGDDGGVQTGPNSTFTAHRSPLGLTFDVDRQLASPYTGAGFVLSWGSAGGTLSDRGEDLQLLRFANPNTLSATTLVRGFRRPIDATLAGKRLYVLEYDGGAIWELTLP